MEDLIITNARIVDGTGAPAYPGDITVNNGIITAVMKAGTASVRSSHFTRVSSEHISTPT